MYEFAFLSFCLYPCWGIFWHEGGRNDWFEKQDKGAMTWKCVESNALSSMGLTSGVRKVMC